MALKWYSLRTFSGKEKRTSEVILQEAELAGLGELIPEVLVPSENVVEMRAGKKYVRNKHLPFDLIDCILYAILSMTFLFHKHLENKIQNVLYLL